MGSPKLRIFARTGPCQGQVVPVLPGSRSSVGRDGSCDLRLDDPKVSRIHGFFEIHNGDLYYRDNHSTNGTLVNGLRISLQKLEAGDLLQVGMSEFAVLEDSDFSSIQFVNGESVVTHQLTTADVTADALAEKFASMFDSQWAEDGGKTPIPRVDLARQQRLLRSLKSLFSASQMLSRLLPVDKLLPVMTDAIFEMFAGAENVAILLRDSETGKATARYARDRGGEQNLAFTISSTVLHRAFEERVTLVANDVSSDQRFSASDSIMGFSVKSVLCAPLVVADRVLGAIYMDNRLNEVRYDDFDVEILTAFANQAAVALDNARLCDSLQESYHQILQSLVNAMEAKDPYTAGHTQRVKQHALGIGQRLGLDAAHLKRLEMAAELHDIGKIALRDGLINKPGALTETEYHTVKSHVEMGEKILEPISYLRDLLPWIRGHHERWDGRGYPDGLKGEECPLEGRVLAVADSFDAMTSKRSYNEPLSIEEAVGRVLTASGTQFDPVVVEAFRAYAEEHLTEDSDVKPATRGLRVEALRRAREDGMQLSTADGTVPMRRPDLLKPGT